LETFIDKQSGRSADRPQFQAMLAYCRTNRRKISCVIVADLSRLARNIADQATAIAELKKWGWESIWYR
jgi:DNA invertase Pin-like site-specific DNA recombinase